MYSCTKKLNLKHAYGSQRLIFSSFLITVITFLISFEVFSSFINDHFSDKYFLLFILSCLAVYPVHKLCHILLFMNDFNSIIVQRVTAKGFLPILNIRLNHPIKKGHFMVVLIMPFSVISIVTLTAAFLYPLYAHYFLFLFSMNIGISFVDFIYFKYLLKSRGCSFVEERKHGLELLTKFDI
ncbi:DUF3267 domain-containing protein [Macrococcus hajekii]|uniref:DUF3267 domain-containing protein n=1 Tax=Macrococcus hajekii TaxID=198482 RepID=A0A4R6BLB9_9STAP|nr:DUF3267 domain-containing protein [Macrococcus hajekii]TDM02580.1 DUF3267 domain-containing protein [Macrococcus hajekii]GGB02120.1 hypothetical protein GCM10007190_07660 [Macrococcus hajekii]